MKENLMDSQRSADLMQKKTTDHDEKLVDFYKKNSDLFKDCHGEIHFLTYEELAPIIENKWPQFKNRFPQQGTENSHNGKVIRKFFGARKRKLLLFLFQYALLIVSTVLFTLILLRRSQ